MMKLALRGVLCCGVACAALPAVAEVVPFWRPGGVETAYVATKSATSIGMAWVDWRGMPLYVHDGDGPGQSVCYGSCARTWRPLLATGTVVTGQDWTVIPRSDGTFMWAYQGQPLYTYAGDTNPAFVTGDGVGGFRALR